jgi:hypothetical protein
MYPALVLNAAIPSQRAILTPKLLFYQSFSALVCCLGCTTSPPFLPILVFSPRRTRLLSLSSRRIWRRMSCGVIQENPNLSVELPNASHFRTCPENRVLIENHGASFSSAPRTSSSWKWTTILMLLPSYSWSSPPPGGDQRLPLLFSVRPPRGSRCPELGWIQFDQTERLFQNLRSILHGQHEAREGY